jgi:hypothetical protein
LFVAADKEWAFDLIPIHLTGAISIRRGESAFSLALIPLDE